VIGESRFDSRFPNRHSLGTTFAYVVPNAQLRVPMIHSIGARGGETHDRERQMHGAIVHPYRDYRGAFNRGTRSALLLNMIVPLFAVLLVNALIFAGGLQNADPAFTTLAFAPPGWVIGAVWAVIFPMWGAARWHAWQAGRRSQRESWWIVWLMAWGLLYPLTTAAFDLGLSAVMNVLSLALAVVTAARVRPLSPTAFRLIVPSIAWVAFACVLGFAALANR
jgi:translocator protein